jgi:hypothetical protein
LGILLWARYPSRAIYGPMVALRGGAFFYARGYMCPVPAPPFVNKQQRTPPLCKGSLVLDLGEPFTLHLSPSTLKMHSARGTSLIRNSPILGPYSRSMPMALRKS